MGETEEEATSLVTLKFPLVHHAVSIPSSSSSSSSSSSNYYYYYNSPEHHPSGSATPPLQTLASVPFKWEEQPGKPRRTTTQTLPEPTKLCLELPPNLRIMSMDRITKTPSPTAVLDGPYDLGRPRFHSFRFFRPEAHIDSFYNSTTTSSTVSPEISADVKLLGGDIGGKKLGRAGGYFRKFRSGRKNIEVFGTSFREGVKMEKKITSSQGSFSSVSHHTRSTHIWAAIYEGLKQVIPWKSGSKRSKKADQV